MHSMVQVSYFSRLSYQFYVSFFFPACIHIVSKFILKTAGINQSIYGGHIWPAVFRCRLVQVSLACSISLSLQGVLIPLIGGLYTLLLLIFIFQSPIKIQLQKRLQIRQSLPPMKQSIVSKIPLIPIKFLMVEPDQRPCPATASLSGLDKSIHSGPQPAPQSPTLL